MRVLSAVFLAGLLSGCASQQRITKEQLLREDRPLLHQIKISEEINEHEAELIAEAYFTKFDPTRFGSRSKIYDGGQEWISNTALGNTVIKHFFSEEAPVFETKEPIRINKKTGRVTWSDGPTVDDPRTIADN